MKTTAFAVALLALTSGCPGTKPAAPVATEPLVEEQKVDIEGAREVLEPFLEARWRFEKDASLQYVTAEDADNVWSGAFDDWIRLADMVLKGKDWRSWYSWRIESIEPLEQGRARATVEVVLPTSVSMMSFVSRSNMARMMAMTKVRDPRKMQMVVERTQTAFIPTRLVFPMTYELVRDGSGEWKVWMNWRALQNFDEENADTTRFEGSERRWFEAKKERSQGHPPEKLRDVREIARGAREAERLARNRRYDAAIERYDKLLLEHDVPDFVAERPTQLAERQQAWEDRLAEAKLNAVAEQPVPAGDEHVRYAAKVANRGTRKIAFARIRLEHAAKEDRWAHSPSVVLRDLSPGGITVAQTISFTTKGPQQVDRAVVETFRFEGEEEDPTGGFDHEYRWKLQDYERGYRASYAATRVSTSVRSLEDELHDCPGWPEEPTDVRVDITPEGAISRVGSTDGDDAFEECLTEVVSELRFPATEKRWGAVVQLFPRDYWEKLGARDR